MDVLRNARQANRLTKPGRYWVADTLFLRVMPSGSKQWVQRLNIDGKRRDIGLGGFPLFSFDDAKAKAWENRKIARSGGDPLAGRRRERRIPTFRDAAGKALEALRPRWRNGKQADEWLASMEKHVLPKIGNARVDRLARTDVLGVLLPIWTRTPASAKKVRQRINAVLAWAQSFGHVSENVADGGLDGALPKGNGKHRTHHRALNYRDVSGALADVDSTRSLPATKLCLRFAVLTAARTGEALGARWCEIDAEARIWTVPADRMKAGREHRVPLSEAAVAVLARAMALQDGSGLVFPSPRKRGHLLSDNTLLMALKYAGLADRTTVHGFRSSFRNWCAETGQPREVAEAALAHIVPGVEGAYFRSDLFDRRRALMDSWAAFLAA